MIYVQNSGAKNTQSSFKLIDRYRPEAEAKKIDSNFAVVEIIWSEIEA
ncbi:MAG: hypothetical protein AAGE84_17545 [Cyanobacteria bacterium P01_G01_bin.39]